MIKKNLKKIIIVALALTFFAILPSSASASFDVSTGSASVTDHSALVSGILDTGHKENRAWFEYNSDGDFTNNTYLSTTEQQKNTDGSQQQVSFSETLTATIYPQATYYYRACGNRKPYGGKTCGATQSFTTQAAPVSNTGNTSGSGTGNVYAPSSTITNVSTGGYTNLTDTSVKLSGSLNPGGALASGYFRYSTSNIPPVFCNDIYGSNMSSTNETNLGSGNSAMTFTSDISGLLPNTKYYFCAIGSNKNEIKYGGVNYFTTKITINNSNNNPSNTGASITTNSALVVNSSSAYLNGFFNSNFPTDTWFEYRKKASVIVDTMDVGIITNTTSTAKTVGSAYPIPMPNNFSINGIATPTSTTASKPVWTKVGLKSHSVGTSGKISSLVTGLSPSTTYEFRAGIKVGKSVATASASSSLKTTTNSNVYGSVLTFQTKSSNNVTPGNVTNGTGQNSGASSNTSTPTTPLALGQTATPPADAVVRFQEGIETVLARQIAADPELAKLYGYQMGTDLQSFAWYLADLFARDFGYVNPAGKEIRVSKPDIAAYEIQFLNDELTIYEYYNSKIVNIQKTIPAIRSNYYYEYYYNKR